MMRNPWKVAFLVLVALVVGYGGRWVYWHERWHDEELFQLRRDRDTIVLYIQRQIAAGKLPPATGATK